MPFIGLFRSRTGGRYIIENVFLEVSGRRQVKRSRTAEDQELGVDLHRAGLAMTLAHFRREIGLSQAELAEKAAISQQQLSKLEKGDNCNLATFLRVCEAMDVELICVRRREPGDSQAGRK